MSDLHLSIFVTVRTQNRYTQVTTGKNLTYGTTEGVKRWMENWALEFEVESMIEHLSGAYGILGWRK